MAKSVKRPYPRRTLDQALRIPRALRDKNGGKPWAPKQVAEVLDVGVDGGNFFYLTSASKQYGLTEGTSRTSGNLALTDLGRKAVYPSSSDEERQALREAFLNVPLFRRVLEHYGGNNLPERRYRENTLFTQFDLDPSVQDEFVDLLNKNSRLVGIGSTFHSPSTADALQFSDGDSGAETIATPAEAADSAPVCFVIMPFEEKEEDRPTGFSKRLWTACWPLRLRRLA